MLRAIPIMLLVSIVTFGCGAGEKLPPLFPAEGQVVSNGAPVKGGVLSFRKLTEQKPLAVGAAVDASGHFKLVTLEGRTKHPGAPEGEYHVVYSPPNVGKDAFPVTLANTVAITSKDNKLTLDISQVE